MKLSEIEEELRQRLANGEFDKSPELKAHAEKYSGAYRAKLLKELAENKAVLADFREQHQAILAQLEQLDSLVSKSKEACEELFGECRHCCRVFPVEILSPYEDYEGYSRFLCPDCAGKDTDETKLLASLWESFEIDYVSWMEP